MNDLIAFESAIEFIYWTVKHSTQLRVSLRVSPEPLGGAKHVK